MKAIFALAELGGEVAEGSGGVGVGDAVSVAARSEVHADAAGAEDGDDGVGDLEVQPGTVLNGAAVGVGAVVGAVLEELVEQIAVGAVDLDTVEAGGLGVLSTLAEGLDDTGDLLEREGARGDEGLLGTDQRDVAAGGDGRGGDGKLAIEEAGVGDAADMPELGEDAATGLMHGGDDGLPRFGLLLVPDAGHLGVADAEGIDGDALGEDQAGGGALRVVLPP